MIELTPQQKKEDFNDRMTRFQSDLKGLLENYKIELVPIIQHLPNGALIPQLSINDTRYVSKPDKISPFEVSNEQPAKYQKSMETDKKTL